MLAIIACCSHLAKLEFALLDAATQLTKKDGGEGNNLIKGSIDLYVHELQFIPHY